MRRTSSVVIAGILGSAVACGGVTIQMPQQAPSARQMAELWADPGDQPRDLLHGLGGTKYAPDPDAIYKQKEKDDAGFSVTYDVEGPGGVQWSVKLGPEAQTEVVVSRILWGLGYHQAPSYYLPKWQIQAPDGNTQTISEARFRPKIPTVKHKGDWSWQNNPFIGTRPHNGLLVILLMLNSSDLKNDNNAVYELTEEWDGATRWLTVKDVGAALGETGKLYPRRNFLEGFERDPFILGVNGGHIQFGYHGRHQELLALLTPEDVRWGAERMSRLTDQQWHDAFRTANYADSVAERYIALIKQRIAEGLAFGTPGAAHPQGS